MNLTWLLRAARWARNPPSPGRVKLVLGVIAFCVALVVLEWLGLWPEVLNVETPHRVRGLP